MTEAQSPTGEATFGSLPLLAPGPVTSGAVLPLSSKPPTDSLTLGMDDGWSLRLHEGLQAALITGPDLLEERAAEMECRRALYRALDILSVRNICHLAASGVLQSEKKDSLVQAPSRLGNQDRRCGFDNGEDSSTWQGLWS